MSRLLTAWIPSKVPSAPENVNRWRVPPEGVGAGRAATGGGAEAARVAAAVVGGGAVTRVWTATGAPPDDPVGGLRKNDDLSAGP